jgi:hypothetical protein
MTALILVSPKHKIKRREVCGLSYAGINQSQVQRVSLSLKINQEAPLAFTDVRPKLKEKMVDCKHGRPAAKHF